MLRRSAITTSGPVWSLGLSEEWEGALPQSPVGVGRLHFRPKGESRRLLGDVVLSRDDVLSNKVYADGCVATTWPIDLHLPDKQYLEAAPDNPFIARAEFTHLKKPYLVPYRCLYS